MARIWKALQRLNGEATAEDATAAETANAAPKGAKGERAKGKSGKKSTPAKKAPKTPKAKAPKPARRRRAARGEQDGPSGRDALSEERRDAVRDYALRFTLYLARMMKPGRGSCPYQAKNSSRPRLYTRFVIGEETESRTRDSSRCPIRAFVYYS